MYAARLSTALLFVFIPAALSANSTTSHPLTIELQDHRPIPSNLIPTLTNADRSSALAGEISSFTSGKDPDAWYRGLTAMHAITTSTFTTSASVNRTNLWLLIDHPGYLRLYSTQIPDASDPRTTVVITLPVRGELRATLDLDSLRTGADYKRWQEALKDYCFESHIEPRERFSYYVHYKHPLQDWQFQVGDLAPGKYKLFGTGRWCDATSGPAGYGTVTQFNIRPGESASFIAPVYKRNEMPEYDKPTSPDISYQPLLSDRPPAQTQ